MTTILADANLGVMVSDTQVLSGDRKFTKQRKVFRVRNFLVGIAGDSRVYLRALDALKKGEPLQQSMWGEDMDTSFLVLSPEGLFHFAGGPTPERVATGIEAIGSGASAAMAAYEAMSWQNPRRAVSLAVKYDTHSGAPVRQYHLPKATHQA
jgi:ATP-dependent protease HslVU (ClpYQ) peptidase subunit